MSVNINQRLQSYQTTHQSIDRANLTQPTSNASSSTSSSLQAYNPIRYDDAIFRVLYALPDLLAAEYTGDLKDIEVEVSTHHTAFTSLSHSLNFLFCLFVCLFFLGSSWYDCRR